MERGVLPAPLSPTDFCHCPHPPFHYSKTMPAELISLIVPTLNEAENIPLLVPRLAAALAGRPWELIIVDDNSHDRTPEVCAELAKTYPLRLLVREHPLHGLSGAVLEGIALAKGDLLVVMDADLQHPPEKVPELLAVIESGQSDFALGSRNQPGGSTEGEWGAFRRLNSWVATLLARPFAGRVKDPMSGFFALKRSTYTRAQRLTPLGYKIALELICKCQVTNVVEVPIHFGLRQHGQSKLSLKQQFRYLEHLSRLYDFTFPRLSPILKFLVVLCAGWLAGLAAYLVTGAARLHPVAGIAIAYDMNLLVTAAFHARYIRTQREFLLSRRPWGDFALISLGEWATAIVTAIWLASRLDHPGKTELFILAFAAGTVMRYMLRKELLQDIRGLRKDVRAAEIARV